MTYGVEMLPPEAAMAETAGGNDPARLMFWDDFDWEAALAVAGVAVTPSTARLVPTVQACVDHLVRPVSTLPLMVHRRRPDGAKEALREHPLAPVLRERPNADQDASEFWSQFTDDFTVEANALAIRVDDDRGRVRELIPVPWCDVERVERDRFGARWYRLRHPWTGERSSLRFDEVWHARWAPYQRGGLVGRSRVELGRHAIGEALAVTLYGQAYFRNVGRGGFLEGSWKDYASAQQWVEGIAKARSGGNRGKTVALPTGAKYVADQSSNEEAQYIELRKELKVEICQVWNMPPHKVGVLDRATFSNIEQQSLEFVVDTLRPPLVALERSAKRWLLDEDEDVFVEFNVAGLLRGDIAARYQAYATARQWGWLSVNEIRSLENMNPVGAAGDTRMQPLNMGPLGAPGTDGSAAAPALDYARTAGGVWIPH